MTACFCIGGPNCCIERAKREAVLDYYEVVAKSKREFDEYEDAQKRAFEDVFGKRPSECGDDVPPSLSEAQESIPYVTGSASFKFPAPGLDGQAEDPWWPVRPIQ